MNRSVSVPFVVLIALSAMFVVHAAYYFPELPEKVATHWNESGDKYSWMSKTELTVAAMLTIGFMVVIATFVWRRPAVAAMFWFPHVSRQRLTPESQSAIASSVLWIECLIALVWLATSHHMMRLNTGAEKVFALPMIPTLTVLVSLLVFVIGRIILNSKDKD